MNPVVAGLYLHIKFRAFLITFGTFEKALELTVSPAIGFKITSDSAPDGASTIINERGVTLKAWLI